MTALIDQARQYGRPESRGRLLIVDDDSSLRRLLGRVLARHGYHCTLARDAAEAESLLSNLSFELVLADMKMPGRTGLWLADHVFANYPDTAVMMVTGIDDTDIASRSLDQGAYGYVIKPFEPNEIVIGVANALRRRALEIDNRRHREKLEHLVAERTVSLQATLSDLADATLALRNAQEETVRRLAAAAEFHDATTGRHLERMSQFSAALARAVGLPAERCELIRSASAMHDVGKIAIADSILRKRGALDEEELVEMRRHPEIGHAMLAGSQSELLDLGAKIALTHHERFDGRGYPAGMSEFDIPIEGRIVALADVFDALLSERPYKAAFSFEQALAIITAERAKHFDPDVVDAFLSIADSLHVFVTADLG